MANKNYTSKAFQNAIFKNFLIKKSIKWRRESREEERL
jgi:hypothetical protein